MSNAFRVQLVFEGEPKAVQSVRGCIRGVGKKAFIHHYQPKEQVDWKKAIGMLARQQLPSEWKPIDSGIAIWKAVFAFSPPQSLSKKDKEILANGGEVYKITKPDMQDNCMKGLCDALSDIIWTNDSRICLIEHVRKVYSNRPRIELEIGPVFES